MLFWSNFLVLEIFYKFIKVFVIEIFLFHDGLI